MKKSISIPDLAAIGSATAEFLEMTKGRNHLAFRAPMGAGKTTFIVALCKALGVTEPVCSPTFAIINEYLAADGSRICHFDFYRIKNNAEAMDIGIMDYFDSGDLCLMEWPENIEDLLPDDTLEISIKVNADLSREISWEE